MKKSNDIGSDHKSAENIAKSLNMVILGITFGMAFFTVFNGPTFNTFIRSLGGSDFIYSLIIALPVVGGVVQLFGAIFLEHYGRRKPIFLIAGMVHRFSMIPIALAPVVFPDHFAGPRIIFVIGFLFMGSCANSITSISFSSWMGALVPTDIRGKFFSKRSMISTITAAVTSLGVGKFLDVFPSHTGYAVIFITVAILGAADIFCFIWVYEPPMEKNTEFLSISRMFKIAFSDRNYIKFIAFIASWTFAVGLTAPFFPIFSRDYLHLSYFQMTFALQFASSIVTILIIRKFGAMIDRFGNKPIQRFFCTIILVFPMLWLFTTPDRYFIVVIIGIFSGATWPIYDMTVLNLSIWLAPEKNRSVYIAFFSLCIALFGSVAGNLTGGALMGLFSTHIQTHKPIVLGNIQWTPYHYLFALSSIARFLVLIFLQNGYHEEGAATLKNVIRHYSALLSTSKTRPTKPPAA